MTSRPQGETNEEDLDATTLESAEADSAEQHADTTDPAPNWTSSGYSGAEMEASEADAVEQLQEVELDENDYR